MGVGDVFGFYLYTSDNTNVYTVKLTANVAAAGGFTATTNPLQNPGYPFGPVNMRHVLGKDAAGHRTRLPCAASDDVKFINGGSFTLGARTYTIEGAIGEKRKLNFLGG